MGTAKASLHGIWIPYELMMESALSKTAIMLLCDIACFAEYYKSRSEICKFLKVSAPHVSVLLKELKDAGMIEEVGKVFNKKLYTPTQKTKEYFGEPTDEKNVNNKTIIKKIEEENKQLLQQIHQTLGGEKPVLPTPKRLKQVKARRKNFSPEEILQAAHNLTLSDFHMGKNEQHKKYATVDFLLKSDERVEEWLNEKIYERHREELLERLIL